MSARIEHQAAYILHRRPYRETSWLLDVLTPDHGRLSMVAKGARSRKSGESALYQPFVPLWLGWMGRGSLKTLTGIEMRIRQDGRTIPFDLSGERLFIGFYLNELLQYLLPEQDPAPQLFDLYESSLQDLSDGHSIQITLRLFEKLLLEMLGTGVSFEFDGLSGEPVQATRQYLLLPETGFVAVEAAQASAADRRVVPGRVLLAIANHDFTDADTLRSAKWLMRQCIDVLLGGRTLRSRELIRQFKESQRA